MRSTGFLLLNYSLPNWRVFFVAQNHPKKKREKKMFSSVFVLGEGARPESILQKILGQNGA